MSRSRRTPRSLAEIRATDTPNVRRWELRLYVAGKTPKSIAAQDNLRRLCEEHLKDRYSIEVVDLIAHPHLAKGDEIVAIPTLIRKLPEPIRRVIGDLSNVERVLVGLHVRESLS
ncbi:MAG TPA: circadian clock KaiB family protein [Gemmatimonadales bacterium]|jgi:circadian clock protein KaiB|nr:circadian clock KaiB family protein [Gemmatimonadales bacterium]